MKFRLSTVYHMKPAFEFHIGEELFFKGVRISFVFWRWGKSLVITTNKIYDAYMADVRERAKRHQQELRDKEEQLALEIAHEGN